MTDTDKGQSFEGLKSYTISPAAKGKVPSGLWEVFLCQCKLFGNFIMAVLAHQRQATSNLLEDLLKAWVNQSFGCLVKDSLGRPDL